jgi:RNA polymerase sigma-70 factor (ECF subfamily)
MKEDRFQTSLGLIQGAKQRNENDLTRMYFVYSPYVSALLLAFGVAHHDVDDLRQDVFRKVLESISEFEHASFRGWLKAITRNTVIDHHRRSSREAAPDSDVVDEQVESREPQATDIEWREYAGVVERALQLIRPEFTLRQWQVFDSTTRDAKSANMVAEELDLSAANVRKIKSRILHRLREELGDITE